jgi:glycine hydroxymethyltransferase
MRGASLRESLTRSLERQRKILGASVILTPVDSIPLFYDEQDITGFLHGLYISDKLKNEGQKKESIIQFSGRERATRDLSLIHRKLAQSLGAAAGSLRLLSGLHAHVAVFMSLAGIGDSVLRLPVSAGGHFATEGILRRLGLRVSEMAVDRRHLCVDPDATLEIVRRERPKFVFVDRSEGLRYEDFRFLGQLQGPVKIFDASQYLPQIICGHYENPLRWGFDLLVFSVHKSFPGPQKAGVAARESGDVWQSLLRGLGELVSSAHPESSYRVGLVLADEQKLCSYTTRLLGTAVSLEERLLEAGVPAFRRELQGQGDWPPTQHLWIPLGTQEKAFDFFRMLERARVHTTYRLLPYSLGWGVRMGTTAAAVAGLSEDGTAELAHIITDVFQRGYSLKARQRIRALAKRMSIQAMTKWPYRSGEGGLSQSL